MSRMDVGGSTAWTQQGFQAYGVGGGERNEVEGILVNEGSGQMYYTDFSSFEEISVTAVGNTAEVGTPGAFSNFVSKSGSNTYHGTRLLRLRERRDGSAQHRRCADRGGHEGQPVSSTRGI